MGAHEHQARCWWHAEMKSAQKKKKTFKEFEFLCDDEKSVQSEWEFRDLGFGCESATSVEAPKLSEPQFSHL